MKEGAVVVGSCFSFLRFLVILSIPLAFVAVVVASYLHYLPYKMPLHSVVTISIIFFIFMLFIPHNAYFASCKIINNFKDMKKDLKHKIRTTLLKINNEKKSTLNISEYLEKYFSDIKNDNYASVATTIFPMLGILGTFISIAISMPNFSVTTTDALDREISILLDGVGTAFYASIYGIFLSIWWIFFDKRGLGKLNKYAMLIKKDFSKYLWDETSLNHFKIAQNQIHNQDLIDSLRENFNIHFMKTFNDSYIKSYRTLMEDTTRNFSNINRNIHKSVELISDSLTNITDSKNSVRAIVEIDKKLGQFNEAINSLDSILDKTFHKIDSEVADIVNKLADFAEVVVQKSDDVEKSLQEYHKQVKKLVKE
jgi:methyl-accepting chemotaxis protein